MTHDPSYQTKSSHTGAFDESQAGVSLSWKQSTTPNSDSNDWQIIDFPNTLRIQSLRVQEARVPDLGAPDDSAPNPNVDAQAIAGAGSNPTSRLMDNSVAENGRSTLSSEREIELLTLIRDLNECNDVLLQKVSELEEALERSQTALQAEIDHSQFGNHTANGQGATTQTSRPTDRQIAKLVTELELSNQALQRQQVLNETLQASLNMSQEKLSQLEHECTLLQQQHTDESQALFQAEANCRDLRARLHRQQRYTMQFKAALEKCLNVSADSNTLTHHFVSVTDSPSVATSVAMPKTPNIQPWASAGLSEKLDPQLESMIRNVKPNESPPLSSHSFSRPHAGQTSAPAKPSDPEAEDQLWQDLARVIEAPVAPPETCNALADDPSTSAQAITFEPSPWGAPLPDTRRQEVAQTGITPEPQTVMRSENISVGGESPREIAIRVAQEAYVPAMTVQEGAPSPRVAPLKPQKKIKSLAAVDLPSFPKLSRPAQ
jgi:hypothetical protein